MIEIPTHFFFFFSSISQLPDLLRKESDIFSSSPKCLLFTPFHQLAHWSSLIHLSRSSEDVISPTFPNPFFSSCFSFFFFLRGRRWEEMLWERDWYVTRITTSCTAEFLLKIAISRPLHFNLLTSTNLSSVQDIYVSCFYYGRQLLR